jgi:hypothetical protein
MVYNHDICKIEDMVKEKQIVELGSHPTSSTTGYYCIYNKVSILSNS